MSTPGKGKTCPICTIHFTMDCEHPADSCMFYLRKWCSGYKHPFPYNLGPRSEEATAIVAKVSNHKDPDFVPPGWALTLVAPGSVDRRDLEWDDSSGLTPPPSTGTTPVRNRSNMGATGLTSDSSTVATPIEAMSSHSPSNAVAGDKTALKTGATVEYDGETIFVMDVDDIGEAIQETNAGGAETEAQA